MNKVFLMLLCLAFQASASHANTGFICGSGDPTMPFANSVMVRFDASGLINSVITQKGYSRIDMNNCSMTSTSPDEYFCSEEVGTDRIEISISLKNPKQPLVRRKTIGRHSLINEVLSTCRSLPLNKN